MDGYGNRNATDSTREGGLESHRSREYTLAQTR